MRKPVELTAIALVLALAMAGTGFADAFTAKVIGISDGGAITVLRGRQQFKIRLWGIDCPKGGQAYGQRAKHFTADLCEGKTVQINVVDIDRHRRLVANVILPDGRCLNHEIVRAGFAWWFRKQAPGDMLLEQLEAEAREAKRGLWIDPEPVPPWDFRKNY